VKRTINIYFTVTTLKKPENWLIKILT